MKTNYPGGASLPQTNTGDIQNKGSTERPEVVISQGRPQNLHSQSPIFRPLNNVIVAADATFHTLPPSGGGGNTQADWNAASADALGWTLCGCIKAAPTGQQMYRSAYLDQFLKGLPPPAAAPPLVGTRDTAITDVTQHAPGFPLRVLVGTTGGDWGIITARFQVGRGLDNPSMTYDSSTSVAYQSPGDPCYDLLRNWPTFTYISACLWMADGTPLTTSRCLVSP